MEYLAIRLNEGYPDDMTSKQALASQPITVDADSYRENGFLVVEGLVSPDEVEELRADALRICRGEYPHPNLPPVPKDTPDEAALAQYLCIHHPHKISPVIHRFLAQPGMVEVLKRIIGPDVKCMQSMLFIKPPRFPGQAWHQDEIYIPTRDRSLTGGWIALDDATVENGCLWVIPGSHKTGYLYPQRNHNNPKEFDVSQESFGFEDREEIPVECKAGAVVFFNGYLLHRSRKNRSKQYRRVLVNHYMNAWSLLPWIQDPQNPQPSARLDYRDIVMVAGEDPYAWKGLEDRAGVHARPFDRSALEPDPL